MSERPFTEEELTTIEARAAAATPGPWVRSVHGFNVLGEDGYTMVSGRRPQRYDDGTRYDPVPDSEFIAAARMDVPALVAEVRRLRALLAPFAAAGRALWPEEDSSPTEPIWSIAGPNGLARVTEGDLRAVAFEHAPDVADPTETQAPAPPLPAADEGDDCSCEMCRARRARMKTP